MKKNKEVSVRYSSEEYETVSKKAKEVGMPISSFIRTISLLANIQQTGDK